MKVFCDNCKFVRSSSFAMGGVGYRCKKAKVSKVINTPIQKSVRHENIEDKNSNNDCPEYKKSNLFQKLAYANTFG